jgi:hypothetical protein
LGDAIDLCSNDGQADNNKIFAANGEAAVRFDAGCGGANGVAPTGNNNQADDNTINEALLGILTDSGAISNQANGSNFFNVVTTNDPSQSQGMRTRATGGLSPSHGLRSSAHR